MDIPDRDLKKNPQDPTFQDDSPKNKLSSSNFAESEDETQDHTSDEENDLEEDFNFDDYYSVAEVEEEPSAQNNMHRNRQPKFATARDLENIMVEDDDDSVSLVEDDDDSVSLAEESMDEDYDDYYSMAEDNDITSTQNTTLLLNTKEGRTIHEIVMDEVLPFCPAKSLTRFKAVSKGWEFWINSPILTHRQCTSFRSISGLFCQTATGATFFISLNKIAFGMPDPFLSFMPEAVEILSSCNGLIYCQDLAKKTQYVCNPVIKELKFTDLPEYISESKAPVLVFQPSSHNYGADYEIFYPFISAATDPPSLRIYVYYSSKSCYQFATELYFDKRENFVLKDSGFYVDGMVFWELGAGKSMAFNIESQVISIRSLPQPSGVMLQTGGLLGYAHAFKEGSQYFISLYSGTDMKTKEKILVNGLDGGEECYLLPCLESDPFFLKMGCTIFSFEPKTKILNELTHVAAPTVRYISYINSLVKPLR